MATARPCWNVNKMLMGHTESILYTSGPIHGSNAHGVYLTRTHYTGHTGAILQIHTELLHSTRGLSYSHAYTHTHTNTHKHIGHRGTQGLFYTVHGVHEHTGFILQTHAQMLISRWKVRLSQYFLKSVLQCVL